MLDHIPAAGKGAIEENRATSPGLEPAELLAGLGRSSRPCYQACGAGSSAGKVSKRNGPAPVTPTPPAHSNGELVEIANIDGPMLVSSRQPPNRPRSAEQDWTAPELFSKQHTWPSARP